MLDSRTKGSIVARLRSLLTYANVTSTLALVLALGGGAYAAATIDSSDVADNSLRSADVRDNGLEGRDIRNGTVGSKDVANESLHGKDVAEGSLAGEDLADGSLGGGDVKDGSLGGDDVSDESLTEEHVVDLVSSRGVMKLRVGDRETLFRKGPLSFVATCSRVGVDPNTGAEDLEIRIQPKSEEPGSVADLGKFGGGEIDPGDGLNTNHTGFAWTGVPYFMAAPGGETAGGYVGGGVHALGADCAAVATGQGGRRVLRPTGSRR